MDTAKQPLSHHVRRHNPPGKAQGKQLNTRAPQRTLTRTLAAAGAGKEKPAEQNLTRNATKTALEASKSWGTYPMRLRQRVGRTAATPSGRDQTQPTGIPGRGIILCKGHATKPRFSEQAPTRHASRLSYPDTQPKRSTNSIARVARTMGPCGWGRGLACRLGRRSRVLRRLGR